MMLSEVDRVGRALGNAWPSKDKEPPSYVRELAGRIAHEFVGQWNSGKHSASDVERAILEQARLNRITSPPISLSQLMKSLEASVGIAFVETERARKQKESLDSLAMKRAEVLQKNAAKHAAAAARAAAEQKARDVAEHLAKAELAARAKALGPLGDSVYRHPTVETLGTAQRFEALDVGITQEDAEACIAEVGRLAGPLATRGEVPRDLSTWVDRVAQDLEIVLRHLLGEVEHVFEERSGEYRSLSISELENSRQQVRRRLKDVWRESLESSRDMFCILYPFDGPLPHETAERLVEQDRRAAERQQARERGLAAMQEMVAPIQRAAEKVALLSDEKSLAAQRSSQRGNDFPAPLPQPYGVSARGAELWVSDALRWLGAEGVEVTRQAGDGGVDILTNLYAVSVKHYAGSIPVEEVRELFGVATVMRLTPMLWTSGSLTQAGSEFADAAHVPVFHYVVESASIHPMNDDAQDLLDRGL